MDERLLRHYEHELSYLRDMGAEFAQSYPKIASRLGMDSVEVLDPYVERLLEGTAFLAARVQLELELQFPALTNHLLEIVYPQYLAPTPSMMITAFDPDPTNTALGDGFTVPRHTHLRSALIEGVQTSCLYRTAADVTLWPIEIAEVEYIDGRGPLVEAGVAKTVAAKAGIRLRLRRTDGGALKDLSLDRLPVFLDPQGGNPWALHEVLCSEVSAVSARSTDRRDDWIEPLPRASVDAAGFDTKEAILPTPPQSFDGYRLLQEYFAMPQRFHFVELTGLQPAIARSTGSEVDIYLFLRNGRPKLDSIISVPAFRLFATPAVNLFPKRFDRVHIGERDVDHHVVPDRTAPMDYEVYSLDRVVGISSEGEDDTVFHPFYSADDFTTAGDSHPAYYTVQRKVLPRAQKDRLRTGFSSYTGSDMFVSLVDRTQAPYRSDLGQLAVSGMCTNRDIPLLLTSGNPDLFRLEMDGPIKSVRLPVPPTRPRPTLARGDTAWRLISHLSLNYLSIAKTDGGDGAAALREMLGIYAPHGDRVTERQIEGLTSVTSRPVVRRMSDEVLSTAVRGLELKLEFDESYFEGTSVYLLAAVLERFFRKYVSINSFCETVLTTQQRGEVTRWLPRSGLGRII
ncbi:type VI secretion system baseplate subunit TssF [Qingshengfaniella alkalisoli]|uniref:Type VI secretion system baseplate subunit TssF n=1 Tax=Qingshengfaniella alkalisoli TaxID=2599296 RepID=A0A5B8J2B9_9RHOB|nr:type VI secretion system baseplate subunit TssF [Qingshengfaniella alkalisoli]QDY70928.1 type VI secretion system baseplate subunit TssF [Qingshengfaniella alkalisoli]